MKNPSQTFTLEKMLSDPLLKLSPGKFHPRDVPPGKILLWKTMDKSYAYHCILMLIWQFLKKSKNIFFYVTEPYG